MSLRRTDFEYDGVRKTTVAMLIRSDECDLHQIHDALHRRLRALLDVIEPSLGRKVAHYTVYAGRTMAIVTFRWQPKERNEDKK